MRRGFTIIEVSLFLAITGLLFVGITVGTQNSINQQRESDAVNGFVDFLRNVYSEVSNPQSTGQGNSDLAIYGKIITIGESINLNGEANNNNEVFTYDIVGDISGNYGDGTLQGALKELEATMIGPTNVTVNGSIRTEQYGTAGLAQGYIPRWQSKIEAENGSQKKAAILIVRHPRSGTVSTLVWNNNVFEVNDFVKKKVAGQSVAYNASTNQIIENGDLKEKAEKFAKENWKNFSETAINLCINPFGDSSRRHNIRIEKGARNAAGVVVVDLDSNDNVCKK